MRIDILLMWAVAENVKFRVCSSSRFSNGAHARRRCFYRKFDSTFREIKVLQCRPYFPAFRSGQSFFSFLFSLESLENLRVQARENRDLFINNFACHVSLNRHHVTIQINRKHAGKMPARAIMDSEIGNIYPNRGK